MRLQRGILVVYVLNGLPRGGVCGMLWENGERGVRSDVYGGDL